MSFFLSLSLSSKSFFLSLARNSKSFCLSWASSAFLVSNSSSGQNTSLTLNSEGDSGLGEVPAVAAGGGVGDVPAEAAGSGDGMGTSW